MANKSPDTEGLALFRAKRSQTKVEHVKKVIQHSLEYSEEINVNLIAKKSGVSRWFIYSNSELRNMVDGLRDVSIVKSRKKIEQQKATASYASTLAKMKTLQAQCLSLRKELESLKFENKALKEHIELSMEKNQ